MAAGQVEVEESALDWGTDPSKSRVSLNSCPIDSKPSSLKK
jgi:hypothetical protein